MIVGKFGVCGREEGREGDFAVAVLRSARAVVRTSEPGVVVRSGLVAAVLFAGPGRPDGVFEVVLLAQPAVRGSP